MKKLIKSIGVYVLAAATAASCIGTSAMAAYEGSFVEFTDIAATEDAAAKIKASAYVVNDTEETENGSLFIAQFNSDGELVGISCSQILNASGNALEANQETFVSAEVEAKDNTICKAYLWKNEELIPISKSAMKTLSAETALLEGISVDGELLEGFSASQTAYSVEVEQGAVVPVVKGITSDNSVYTTTSYEVGAQSAVATVTAEQGERKETYTVTFNCKPVVEIANSDFHAILGATSDEDFIDDPGVTNGKMSSADVLTQAAGYNEKRKKVFTNLHTHDTASGTPGSRYAVDYNPNEAAFYNMTVIPEDLKGCDYLVSKRDNVPAWTEGDQFEFTLDKPAEVVILTMAQESNLTGYTETGDSSAVIAQAGYAASGFINMFTNLGITPDYSDVLMWNGASKVAAAKPVLAEKYNITVDQLNWSSNYALNAINYTYRYSRTFNAGDTVTIPLPVNSARGHIVALKPIQPQEEPLVEHISDFNYCVGGMNYTEYCEYAGITADPEVQSTAVIQDCYKLGKFVPGTDLCGTNSQRTIKTLNKTTGFENAYFIAPDIYLRQDSITTMQSDLAYSAENDRRWMVSAFMGLDQTIDTDKTINLSANVKWLEFKVNKDCEVIVLANDAVEPAFCTEENSGWTHSWLKGDVYTAERVTTGAAVKSHHNMYVKEYHAGDTVELYNENAHYGSSLHPYLTLVRFK